MSKAQRGADKILRKHYEELKAAGASSAQLAFYEQRLKEIAARNTAKKRRQLKNNPEKLKRCLEAFRKLKLGRTPQQRREKDRRYRDKYPEKIKEKGRRYRAKCPEKIKEKGRRYRAKCPEKIKEDKRRYREKNREQIRARARAKYWEKKAGQQPCS